MNLIVRTVAVLLSITALVCSANADQLDDLDMSVVFLVATPNASRSNVGTGLLLVDGNTPFLVTAEHVARDLSSESLAVIRAKDGTALKIKFSNLIGSSKVPKWRYHETADLAILMLTPDANLIPKLASRFLSIAVLRAEQAAPSRSITLTVLGFPLALGVEGKFSPISRETKPASDLLMTARADTKKPALFFVTQDPSIGGFSGAPVFDMGLPYSSGNASLVIRSRTMQIVGIVHGTMSDDTGGKLGLVTPAHLLLELFSSAKEAK